MTEQSTESPVVTCELPATAPETVFELVADSHRHAIFAYLENTDDGRATVSDLAAYVSQCVSAGNAPAQTAVQLHHVHLPKIDRANLINYDPEQNTVEYIGHPLVEDCLTLAEKYTE